MQTISNTIKKLKLHWLPILVLVSVCWGVFGASIGHQFLTNWDDNKYVTANPDIMGVTAEHLKTVFSSFYVGNYAPVQMVSYMLDYEVWGLRASGFIFSNILLHICNGLLLYWILIKILNQRVAAFLAAGLFLLHPVQVESVEWISQRKNLLSMFFFLLSWIGYARYRRQGGITSYVLSILAFTLALLAKSVAVVAPLVFLVYDFCCEQPELRRKWLVSKIPYIIASMVVAGLALISQRPELGGGRTYYHGGSPLATFYTMLPVFVTYLRLLVSPGGLSAVYEPSIKNIIDMEVAGAALFLIMLAFVCCYLYRKDRLLLFGFAVFFIALLPVSQIIPLVTLMNDRYMYFPMVGAAMVFGRIAVLGGEANGCRWRSLIHVVLYVSLVLIAIISHQRTKVWQNAVTLWSDAVIKTPQSKMAWFGLGNALQNADDPIAAESHYAKALAIDPFYREVLDNLSYLYLKGGEFTKARDVLQVTVLKYPDHRDALLNLGTSEYLLLNFTAAETAYSKALALKDSSAENMILLANVNLRLGRHNISADFYHRATATGMYTNDLLYGMGAYAAISGNSKEALDYLSKAVAAGYGDCLYMRHDPDMETLRHFPAMQRLTEVVCSEKK